ncbi:unnamed protein product [Lactuca virosa]|uniref:GOLD domain-containing protein n=1 Tax=Lactuca virosa TaxID=75947 RepID=A0AAU9LV23_9ASTR|nr:unnamed protein product [Lactuca virosa]
MKFQRFGVCVIVIIGLLSTIAQSIRFELESGHTKCIAEDIKSNSMTVGHYSIVNPNEGQPLPESHRITLKVTSSYGTSYHSSENVQSGQFAFQAVEAGDYMACFYAIDHQPSLKIPIEFDWRSGVASKDWSNVAKKGSVDAMEFELKKLADTITFIHEEMFNLREREREMQELNKVTNSRMAWLSFLSLFVCLSVAGSKSHRVISKNEKSEIMIFMFIYGKKLLIFTINVDNIF